MKVKEKIKGQGLVYFANGTELRPDKHRSARIRFPDKSERVMAIHWRTESHRLPQASYINLDYFVDSQVPYIKLNHRGVEIQIKLTLVEVIL